MPRTEKKIGWLVGCLIVFGMGIASGCGSDPIRYPEDHARFERIVDAVESLRKAYVGKDPGATRELMLPLETIDRLQGEIQRDFQTFTEISLDLTVERVNIRGDLISVYVRWEGEWRTKPEDVGITGGGHGILMWSGTQVILLVDVDGDLPFGMASRQALT